jgi:antitoxin (DNA-binding transcriptional repressor) of toxin-antitoxin stability system
MTSVGIRELKNNLSRYLRRIEAGERFAVTDRGRVVAELGKPLHLEDSSSTRSRYAELVTSGLARPPAEAGDPLADWPVIRLRRGTVAALLDDDRGER